MSWFLPKLRREAAEYAGCTGSDKRRVHVLKFWFQTFNRLFCPADVTSSEGQPTPPWGDAVVRDYHAMCDEAVLAQKMAARLKYHGSTGPMPAHIWPDPAEYKEKHAERCAASVESGYVQPIDLSSSERAHRTTLLDVVV